MNWQNASNYCTNLVLDNYTDWRLPSNDELISLQQNQSLLSYTLVDNYHGTEYWTSKTNNVILYEAYTVEMKFGWNNTISRNSSAFVKCIRNY